METKIINLSVSQELLLRSAIRKEIMRNYVFLDTCHSEGIDDSLILDDIFELKTLYRQITGRPFRI